ncbi:MAG TPA: hypothetical protein VG317_03800 [Pseudonocardiaceae bacterium]|jgi:3-oxoacyl-[acyl-carrier-protein] synthase-3|nr:hypothetical protein [Pseudonocardiaceae bacterium]
MTGHTSYLSAPEYVLGEIEMDHTMIPTLTERANELRIPATARLWGWGQIRRTERGIAELAVASGAATLRAARLDPGEVDALMLCSTKFPGDAHTHGGFVREILTGLGMTDPAFLGITLNRCTNLLAALQVAGALVASGAHRTVLVVTTDRIDDEATRMENFALFSDGAASCLVSRAMPADGFELVAGASAQQAAELNFATEINSDLARRVSKDLLDPLGLDVADVATLSHTNLFTPLVVLKERQAGFATAQLYTENIARIGHCFAADPLINLVDRSRSAPPAPGSYHLLAASVPGSRIGVLLRKLAV